MYSHAGRTKYCKKDRRQSTTVYKAEGDVLRESQQHSSEKQEEARDPDPGVEAQQDFCNIVGNHTCRNHSAPRTKLFGPKDDLPILLNYIDFQRQAKISIDVLHEATIDDYWNVDGDKSLSDPRIGMTRFEFFHKKTPEGHMWVPGRLTKKKVTT